MKKISVVISVFNGGELFKQTLESVGFADEIIVVDNESTDGTYEYAKKFTKNVFKKKNLQMLNTNKNFGFTKASSEWILNLDADEVVTDELREEILEKIEQVSVDGYWIPRKNILFGKWIKNGLWWPDYQLRLFRKGKGMFKEQHVHEYIVVEGKTEKLSSPMIHNNYQTISQYIRKLDTIYTENEAEHFVNSGKKLERLDIIRYPFSDFIKIFFAQKAYKDGMHGLVLSLLQAFYSFIVVAKIWERESFWNDEKTNTVDDVLKETKKMNKEFMYWILTSQLEQNHGIIKKLWIKIKRKFL